MSEQKEEPKQDEQSNNLEVPQQQQPQESVTIDVSQSRQNEQEPPVTSSFRSRLSQYKENLLQRPIKYDIVSIVFALVIFGGGIYGYLAKGSTYSLVAGVVCGILLAFCTYFEGARKNPYPLLATLLFIWAMFTYRYLDKMKFMPSGLLALLTAVMLARNCYLVYLRRQQTVTTSA